MQIALTKDKNKQNIFIMNNTNFRHFLSLAAISSRCDLIQRPSRSHWIGYLSALLLGLGGCQHPPVGALVSSKGHLQNSESPAKSKKSAEMSSALAPLSPSLLSKPLPVLTYDVAVSRVDIQDFLFALARDSQLNVDIHPDVQGLVSLNAVGQTFNDLLDRLQLQIPLRYEQRGQVLQVLPDTPYLVHYPIDYVHISRQITATVSANTQISNNSPADPRAPAAGNPSGGNLSSTRMENTATHHFWQNLEKSVQALLNESAFNPVSTLSNSTNNQNPMVILNPEGNLISVRATRRQHQVLSQFLAQTLEAAQRQVVIEATIVEVELAEGFQQGIDWSRLRDDGKLGFSLTRGNVGGDPNSNLLSFALRSEDGRTPLKTTLAIDLLKAFGQVKVLSSPRLAVLNNQAALLKVVENIIYFTVKADTVSTANVGPTTTVTTTPQSVSVGLVMSVTPQISAQQQVILNVRPTISSVAKFVPDPNPVIPIPNQVPQIRTREIESILRIASGDIALLGGLMEDRTSQQTGQVPGLSEIPLFGELFTTRKNSSRKSELVIFLRPLVIENETGQGPNQPEERNRRFRHWLPQENYFAQP